MSKFESIKIIGFKNLVSFEIYNLKKINYIIGASGAGKSSVWELLVMLNRGSYAGAITRFGNLTHVIKKEAKVTIVLNNGLTVSEQVYTCTPKGESSLSVDVDPGSPIERPDIQYFSSEVKEQGYKMEKSKVSSYDPTQYTNPMETALYSVADQYPDAVLTDLVHITRGNSEEEPTILRGPMRNQQMSTANLSGGHSALASMVAAVQHNRGSVIILEEPENGMHVSLQKSIHGLLKKLTEDNDSVQLIVITHSPFLLGAVASDDHDTNTYLMSDGKALKKEGYDARGARYLASKLVGVSFEDIAPTTICVCEGSLCALMNKVNERFYSAPVFVTSAKSHMGGEASGDEDILSLAEVLDVYKNRFNFFSKANMIFIIDKPNVGQRRLLQRVEAIRANDTKVIELPETKLEEHYSRIEGLTESDISYILDVDNKKTERATRVGERITKSEFERVFPKLVEIFDSP